MITNFDDLIPEDEVGIDADTRDALIMWAGEHALYFFAKRTLGVAKLGVRLEELLPSLLPQPSQNGLSPLASARVFVGDSDASNPTSTDSSGPSQDEK
jgi:hypothetical protein